MLTWWRRRKEREQQVLWDTDDMVPLFGDGAYSDCLRTAVAVGQG